ncbi:MAG: hypothetical protein ACOVOI_06275, partial [Hyphomicrobiales bacterium]
MASISSRMRMDPISAVIALPDTVRAMQRDTRVADWLSSHHAQYVGEATPSPYDNPSAGSSSALSVEAATIGVLPEGGE